MTASVLLPRAARRKVSITLAGYVARQFLLWFLSIAGILTLIIAAANLVDMMDRLTNKTGSTLSLTVELALLRVPQVLLEVLPFAVLGAAMGLFWRLTRTHELVVTRAAGVSIWQFLAPPVIVAILIGIFAFSVLNPLSATLLKRYAQLEALHLGRQTSVILLAQTGLWLRQQEGGETFVIHAEGLGSDASELKNPFVLRFEDQDRFVERVDAKQAFLDPGFWRLENVLVTQPGKTPEQRASYTIPTELTRQRLTDNFAPAETISFWQIPSYAAVLENAGFPANPLHLQFHRLLATPLLFTAMVIIAATFSLRSQRRGGVTLVIGAGVITGFVLFFLSNFVFALGLSGKLPLILAAWTPTGICLMLGVAMLLHLEDG